MIREPWTPVANRYLREHYVADGATACARALDRSFPSVAAQARRLGIVRFRRWTQHDDARLQVLWGVHPIASIARTLGRTPDSIYWRAKQLELGLGCPQGHEYLSAAAARTGYAVAQLRRILAWAHVRIDRASTRPDHDRKTKHVTWVVEPSEVDEAVAAWHQTETLERAAERHVVCSSVLARLLREAAEAGEKRVPPRPRFRKHWRIPTELVDELLGAYKSKESVRAAAFRVQVTAQTLAGWLVAAGVPYSRRVGVDPAEVDRVVAEKRAAGCHAWRRRGAA